MDFEKPIEFQGIHKGSVRPNDLTVEIDLINGTKAMLVPEKSKLGEMLKVYRVLREIEIDLEQCVEALELMNSINAEASDQRHRVVALAALWRSAVIGYGCERRANTVTLAGPIV